MDASAGNTKEGAEIKKKVVVQQVSKDQEKL